MRTRQFWADLGERVIATAAQSLVALLGVSEIGILDVDWAQAASVAGLAALLSALKAIAATRIGDPDSAALLPKEITP